MCILSVQRICAQPCFPENRARMEAISSPLIATQHSLPLPAYCHGPPLLTFSWLFVHFSLLVLWWLLCTAGKRLPDSIQFLALRSRNTSTAFKLCFGWFLQHLKQSCSEKDLNSLHCLSRIIYCLYTLQSVHALCGCILRIF